MRALWQDVRYGVRALAKSPGFTAVAALSLALGIAGTTAIFSVIDQVLLRPLPFAEPERLVIVWENDRLRGTQRERASMPDFLDFRAQARVFDALSAWQSADLTLTGQAEPERVVVGRVSANFFEMLGAKPLLGRTFAADEEQAGKHRVAVLSHKLWQQRFGANPNVLSGAITLDLDAQPYTVIGVMPPEGRILGNQDDLWIPASPIPNDKFRGIHGTRVYARLKPGVSREQAQSEMTTIMRRLEEQYRDDNEGRGAVVVPLHEELVGDLRQPLLILFGAVGLVLLIACVNVANLLLVRGSARQREIAIRAALGAGRGRMIRQLLMENIPLAALGAAAGVVLSVWGVELLRAAGPQDIPRLERASVDARALGFALAVSAAIWFIFSLWPAVKVSAAPSLRASTSRPRAAASRLLVVSEVGLAALLLIGAGLLIRSFWRLLSIDPGYDPKNVLALSLQLSPTRYPFPKGWPILEWSQVTRFQDQLLEKVKALPGVESAALGTSTPLTGGWTTRMTIAGRPAPPPGQQDEPNLRLISEDYFRVARIPLRIGRVFSPQDDDRRPKVGIVNESFVRRYFPAEDPLGHRVNVYGVERQIIGVVANEKFAGLTRETPPAVYLPYRQNPLSSMTLMVRTAQDPLALSSAVQKEVSSLDRDLALFDVMTLEQALSLALAQRRFTMLLLAVFAATALALAAIGLYGVVAYWVTRRTGEIGVRMALGAQPGHVLGLVLIQGFRLAVIGVAAGALGAAALTRFLKSQLFGVTTTDPLTFLSVPILLLVIALAACYLPARRAARVSPMVALRYE